MPLGAAEPEIFTEVVVLGPSNRSSGSTQVVDRAPFEHRRRPTRVPNPMIIMTSGLHAAPVSATEHRSSTEQSTRDTQTILPVANVQVRGLL